MGINSQSHTDFTDFTDFVLGLVRGHPRPRNIQFSIFNYPFSIYSACDLTLEASTLNNRGYSLLHPRIWQHTHYMHPEGVPLLRQYRQSTDSLLGDPFRVDVIYADNIRGCSLRSYPRLLSVDRVAVILSRVDPIINKIRAIRLIHVR